MALFSGKPCILIDNIQDGAKAVGQVLAKLYREANGDTSAVDEYETQRIEREEYDSVGRKQREVQRYVIQETHTEKCYPSVLGSAVFPSNTSTATGHPARLHKSPKTIYNLSFFPSRE